MSVSCLETFKPLAMAAKVMLRCRNSATFWAIFLYTGTCARGGMTILASLSETVRFGVAGDALFSNFFLSESLFRVLEI